MKQNDRTWNRRIRLVFLLLPVAFLLCGTGGQSLKKAAHTCMQILNGVEFVLQKAAVRLICPGLLYTAGEPAKNGGLKDPLTDMAWELFPIYTYIYGKETYETETEGGLVAELLLAEERLEEKSDDSDETLQTRMEEEPEIEPDYRGVEYSKEQLGDFAFVKDTFYNVAGSTSIGPEILDGKALSEMDLKLRQDALEPQILIYHTHSQEDFVDSTAGDLNTTIVGVGAYLATLLREEYGYNVIHNTNVYDFVDGKLDRNQAYSRALPEVEAILVQYPSIEVVIDLHRDGVDENLHLVTELDGKKTAQIMFFNGLSYSARNGPIAYLNNPYITENLAFSLQMKLACEKYYPGLARKNYLNSLRYNLHVRPKSLLVEAGAQTNTLDEMKHAMEPLADVLHKVLGN